jgi:hypothetical protein
MQSIALEILAALIAGNTSFINFRNLFCDIL